MAINIKPDYQAVIHYGFRGMGIYFAEIADNEVANEIYGLAAKHRGIEVDEDCIDGFGYICGTTDVSSVSKPDRLRSYYWVEVAPVFEIRYVARALGNVLMEEHGLTVRLIEDLPPDDPSLRSEVLKPNGK